METVKRERVVSRSGLAFPLASPSRTDGKDEEIPCCNDRFPRLAPAIPKPCEGAACRAGESDMGQRHHLSSDSQGLCLPLPGDRRLLEANHGVGCPPDT